MSSARPAMDRGLGGYEHTAEHLLPAAAALDPELVERIDRRAVEIFAAADEDPAAFKVTSRYVIAVARRS